MDLEQAKAIQRIMHEFDYLCDIHEDYSGHRMYGKTCVGIEIEKEQRLLQAMSKGLFNGGGSMKNLFEMAEVFEYEYNIDDMGKNVIIY